MKERALIYEEFIALAKANYTKGGDGYVECWGDRTFTYFVKEFGPITKTVQKDDGVWFALDKGILIKAN